MRNSPFLIVVLACLLITVGCNNNGNHPTPTDNATSGEISIAVDETFKPIIEAEISLFQSIYTNAKINAEYLPEAECFNRLMQEKVRLVIVSRGLDAEEQRIFEGWKIIPKQVKLAVDAIAFVVHPGNKRDALKPDELAGILSGKITLWSQLNLEGTPKGAGDEITIVFDHAGSSTVRMVKDSILKGDSLSKRVFAAGTNPDVIDYVSKNPGAIGIIGVNWVSDRDSENTREFLEQIKVLELQSPMHAAEAGFFQPYQAYIALKNYPFLRDVNSISREARSGLGTGFVSFVAGEKGQRVILKSGLLPSFAPVRIVEFPPKEGAEDINTTIIENGKKDE